MNQVASEGGQVVAFNTPSFMRQGPPSSHERADTTQEALLRANWPGTDYTEFLWLKCRFGWLAHLLGEMELAEPKTLRHPELWVFAKQVQDFFFGKLGKHPASRDRFECHPLIQEHRVLDTWAKGTLTQNLPLTVNFMKLMKSYDLDLPYMEVRLKFQSGELSPQQRLAVILYASVLYRYC